MAVLEKIIPLFLTIFATLKAQGEPPFGVIQPFPENIYPLEYTSASVTCIAFDASGKLQPDRIEFYRIDDLNRNRKLEGDRFLFTQRREDINGNIKLYTTMTLENATIQDDSQYGELGSYECHAFAKNVSLRKRHGFSVSVITGNEIPTVKVSVSSVLNPDDGIIIFCNLTRRGNEFSTPLKRISWFKDGKLLVSVRNPDPDVKQDFLPPLKLTKLDVQQGGKYTCLLEVKLRHIKEYNVTDYTVIKIVPWLPKPKEDIKEKASKGSKVSFECAAKRFPLEVEWKVKKLNEDSVQACINGSGGHYKIHQDAFGTSILTLSGVDYTDRGFYYCCLSSNCSQNVEDKCQPFILGVRDPLGPLWPFIGIVVEAFVLFLIILIAEKRKKDKEKGLKQ